ncbi:MULTISPECIES: metal ABC transporter permease [unclassified Enterococcus]|uniref:metal ABC transporter permease n=1 Tax=unclassified Enterococcus TaxID=2608891 RepID=UPI0015557B48|nr:MULTISPECIES: metal ABC transporter permease [unclassified Enterococcus]MBS7577309.1 metal ABC transporter permease [Enterococcus sp. MMGLQ5-2]MBS7584598.1 metal ABC transporter permease [Enterococcus sp. MMGLQ5-1]NPD12453.1 metal ABC transporter permease [Enterococcus sp. MMGLQ5-1]NPD37143.1 metal ABC transporter permease [Enterococcus sp. MMGLQ5-2]
MSIFNYEFMIRALLSSFAISLFAPLLGIFLVLRRQSLLSDTLSHVSLLGVALGLFLGINPDISTILIVILAAVALEYLRTVYRTYSEVSTAILMSGGLAGALVLMNLSKGTSSTSIQQYLFGSIVTISWPQVYILFGLLLLVYILFFFFRRPMYVLTFDEDTAYVDGLPTTLISIIFNIITGVAIAIMIPIAGALLVSAIMVLPATIAMRIGRSFKVVIVAGILVGLIGMMSGLFTSYYLETPPGASIALIFIFILLLVGVFKKISVISRKQRKKSS